MPLSFNVLINVNYLFETQDLSVLGRRAMVKSTNYSADEMHFRPEMADGSETWLLRGRGGAHRQLYLRWVSATLPSGN